MAEKNLKDQFGSKLESFKESNRAHLESVREYNRAHLESLQKYNREQLESLQKSNQTTRRLFGIAFTIIGIMFVCGILFGG